MTFDNHTDNRPVLDLSAFWKVEKASDEMGHNHLYQGFGGQIEKLRHIKAHRTNRFNALRKEQSRNAPKNRAIQTIKRHMEQSDSLFVPGADGTPS